MDLCNRDLNGEKIVGTYYKKEFKKNQIEPRIEKVIKKKGDKLCGEVTSIDASNLVANSHLANLTDEIDKIDELKTVPDDLCKLSIVVDNDVVKNNCAW